MRNKDRGPGVKLPPPLIFLSFISMGYLFSSQWPLENEWPDELGYVAAALGLVGSAIIVIAVYSFWHFKTHIEPWQPASTLISSGIFAYTRNPIYLAFVMLSASLGLWLESFAVLLSMVPAIWVIQMYVIAKEEAYLEQRFGADYLSYKNKVRRWL